MVDVVGLSEAVVEADDLLDDGDQVSGRENALLVVLRAAEALVDLVAADLAEVVAARVEEQRVDELLRVVDRGPQLRNRSRPAICG